MLMTKRPRAPYIELIDNYRKAAKRTWRDVDAAAGVEPPTREQWMTGVTQAVPLVGIVRLAVAVGVPSDELFRAVMGEKVSPRVTTLEDLRHRVERLEARLDAPALRALAEDTALAEDAMDAIRRVREAGSEPVG
jgi:hypothetical protein